MFTFMREELVDHMEIRYSSDLHFDHRNIMRYDDRPWQDVEVMNAALVTLWNETVGENDLTYILGDVVWQANNDRWSAILSSLKGHKFIVKGNHDESDRLKRLKRDKVIEGWSHQEVVSDGDRKVVLNHSPMPFFINMHKPNWYHLYGHVHASMDYNITRHVRSQLEALYEHPIRMYNVGCMVQGYVPRPLDEIIALDEKANNQ